MKQALLLLLCFVSVAPIYSQTVNGEFPLHAGDKILLEGFDGFSTYEISRSDVSGNGNFMLSYTEDDIGIGQIVTSDGSTFVVVLSSEDIKLRGESLSQSESIEILDGKENQIFEQYASEHPRREQALSAWRYLEEIYLSDSLFVEHESPLQAIQDEKERIRQEDQNFLESLDPQTYVSWYLPVRRLVSSVPVVAQYRTEEIPATINAFRELDHTDPRLYRSGLLGDVIESHVWLIENSGRSLDSVFVELNQSIDILTDQLIIEPDLFNEIMEYLFVLLDERSLFTSSEYLALSLLEDRGELLTSHLASKLEIYRAMKPGNTAPDIQFNEYTLFPNGVAASRFSDIESEYILVVFAAGWCEDSRKIVPELDENYPSWREEGVEVVLVSLDEAPEDYEQFVGDLPFIRTTDFQKWEGPIVKDYHIHSVPAMILLNNQREILVHPNSVQHLNAWVDWYLVQDNM